MLNDELFTNPCSLFLSFISHRSAFIISERYLDATQHHEEIPISRLWRANRIFEAFNSKIEDVADEPI